MIWTCVFFLYIIGFIKDIDFVVIRIDMLFIADRALTCSYLGPNSAIPITMRDLAKNNAVE